MSRGSSGVDELAGRLPAGFRFGTSTAAYQIEGAVAEDGRGPSIWDTFCAEPGRVADGSSGEVACDHYHRVDEDVALMQGLGTTGYRFSIAWPRVVPTGSGAVNAAGLDFYDRLVDTLLATGQEPMATLYHWDLPQPLEDAGGWLSRDTVERFGAYAEAVAARLGDRVTDWVPINEPNVASLMGYGVGMLAPGRALLFDAQPVTHHLLLAHGRAVAALRAAGVTGRIGCANNHAPVWPASDSDADVGAAKLFDALWNGQYVEPMLMGRYPADIAMLMGEFDGLVLDGDLAAIRQPLDFYGLNYYNPMRVAATADDADLPFAFREVVGHPLTDFGWPVVPDALRELLITLRARYRAVLPPVVITESGCSYAVGPDAAGVVADQDRIDYHAGHLRAVAEANSRGADVRGYYCWSLLDNFEWADGYQQRFGLVWVDFATQQRIPKASYRWYADLIAAHRARQPSAPPPG
ncbi:GH1 family beta-glucosidase [Nocardioides ultimimeridianus]